jgi:hypothetical protein
MKACAPALGVLLLAASPAHAGVVGSALTKVPGLKWFQATVKEFRTSRAFAKHLESADPDEQMTLEQFARFQETGRKPAALAPENVVKAKQARSKDAIDVFEHVVDELAPPTLAKSFLTDRDKHLLGGVVEHFNEAALNLRDVYAYQKRTGLDTRNTRQQAERLIEKITKYNRRVLDHEEYNFFIPDSFIYSGHVEDLLSNQKALCRVVDGK